MSMCVTVRHIPPGGIYCSCMHTHKPNEKLIRRLKIIEGQVRGLQDMLLKNTYCIDVITQTSAVKQALSGIEDVLMKEHLGSCVVDQMKQGKDTQYEHCTHLCCKRDALCILCNNY
jgi:DNA-binding FrmR family transcriptional regulator